MRLAAAASTLVAGFVLAGCGGSGKAAATRSGERMVVSVDPQAPVMTTAS